jgi:hypothetical protein
VSGLAIFGPVTCAPPELCIEVPMRMPSRANERSGATRWDRHRLVEAQHRAVSSALLPHRPPPLPLTVRLTRIAPRELDDDNLRASTKAVRDSVAKWLGVDDRSPLVWWLYGEPERDRLKRPKYEAARIEVWRGQVLCAECGQRRTPPEERKEASNA